MYDYARHWCDPIAWSSFISSHTQINYWTRTPMHGACTWSHLIGQAAALFSIEWKTIDYQRRSQRTTDLLSCVNQSTVSENKLYSCFQKNYLPSFESNDWRRYYSRNYPGIVWLASAVICGWKKKLFRSEVLLLITWVQPQYRKQFYLIAKIMLSPSLSMWCKL